MKATVECARLLYILFLSVYIGFNTLFSKKTYLSFLFRFTGAVEGVDKLKNTIYLHSVIRNIVTKFDSSSSYSL